MIVFRSMKIVFLVKYNFEYQAQFEKKNSHLKSYDAFVEALIEDHFLMYSSYIKYLRKNYNHEVHLIVPNWEHLNQLWATKMGLKVPGEHGSISAQISQLQPDIVFVNSNFDYYQSAIQAAEKVGASLCTWISCPIPEELDISKFSVVFTLFPPYVEAFEKQGVKVVLTQAGFDPGLLPDLNDEQKYDLTFVGGIGGYHRKREKYLKYLIPRTSMKVWGYGFSSVNPIKRILKQILNRFIYIKAYQGKAWGKEMFQILRSSKISFNAHGDLADKYSVNMRMFEATGCGTLLVTEENDYLNNFFKPGEEVVTYKDEKDALEKINYYLSNEEERKKIALQGQKRTLENYSYEKLVEVLNDEFSKLVAKS